MPGLRFLGSVHVIHRKALEFDHAGTPVPETTAHQKAGTFDVAGQSRSFSYSPGGFLVDSVEPERRVLAEAYDALGNLLAQTRYDVASPAVSVAESFDYDPFGRLWISRVDGVAVSTLEYGSSGSGYNRLVTALENPILQRCQACARRSLEEGDEMT